MLTINADGLHSEKFHNDEKWVDSFRKGEEKAFNFFFREYHAVLCYFSFQVLVNHSEAEEVVGDAFIKLWDRHTNFSSIAAIRSFLYTTIKNASLNRIRQQKKDNARLKSIAYMTEHSEENRFQAIIEAETYNEIFSAIKKLPPQCRKIFQMMFFQGKDYEQIAKELGLSVSTVRNQKARGLQLLKKKFILSSIGNKYLFHLSFLVVPGAHLMLM